MAMTKEEALNTAVDMYNQGVKVDQIAKHLASSGYRSPKTGNPLKAGAVRAMILEKVQDEKVEMGYTPPSSAEDLIRAVQGLISLDAVTPIMKRRMLVSLLNAEKGDAN